MKKRELLCVLLASCFVLTACQGKKLEPVYENLSEHKAMTPIEQEKNISYEREEAVTEAVETTVQSKDGLVKIEKRKTYYEAWISLDQGSHYDCGKAYAQAILEIFPDFIQVMEPYLYENINMAFKHLNGDYTALQKRISDILPQVPQEYKDEIQGFAEKMAEADHGFVMDGMFSEEEVFLLNLIPDVLRPTQCSGTAVYGEKSATGQTITGRILEWGLGNESQMTKAQAVVHFVHGEQSFTSYTVLGLLDALSVYNDDGVFLAILDSDTKEVYESEGRNSYTFNVRRAAETQTTAKSAADYLADMGDEMTFSHNVLVTDSKSAYVAEICPRKEAGICAVRSADSKLKNGLEWENPDSLCVVNGFALEKNFDNMTGIQHNLLRWDLFNEGLKALDQVTVSDIKDILTSKDPNNTYVEKLYSNYTFQMILVDSSTGHVEIAFAPEGRTFPKHPQFIQVQ